MSPIHSHLTIWFRLFCMSLTNVINWGRIIISNPCCTPRPKHSTPTETSNQTRIEKNTAIKWCLVYRQRCTAHTKSSYGSVLLVIFWLIRHTYVSKTVTKATNAHQIWTLDLVESALYRPQYCIFGLERGCKNRAEEVFVEVGFKYVQPGGPVAMSSCLSRFVKCLRWSWGCVTCAFVDNQIRFVIQFNATSPWGLYVAALSVNIHPRLKVFIWHRLDLYVILSAETVFSPLVLVANMPNTSNSVHAF